MFRRKIEILICIYNARYSSILIFFIRSPKLVKLIVKGLSQHQLMRHVSNSWGLSSEQASHYIREARDVVKADLGFGRLGLFIGSR